jgi:hypothetical protein
MHRLPRWIARSIAPGLVLSSAMLVTFGCSEGGPGVAGEGDPSKSAPSPESFKGKKPDKPEGTAANPRGKKTGADRVSGVAPNGAQ